MGKKVTVLIPFYNPGSYIQQAIDSVFYQTHSEWDLILINDASTDNSIEIIQPYLEDSRVKLVTNFENLGQAKSMNIGLWMTETPYLIQLDADDWFQPETLETFLGEMEQQQDHVALVSGNINFVFENRRGKHFRYKEIKGKGFKDKYEFLLANRSVWPRFYRTSALKRIGGWPTDDPYGGRYAEDLRVLTYLIENHHFYWIDRTLLNHRRHAQNQTNDMQIYGEIVEWIIRDALKRWGAKYDPLLTTNEDGWTLITGLKAKME